MAMPESTLVARPRAPDLIPGYRLDVLIGRGGMGEVYRATQLSLKRTVAIKLLSTELAKDEAFVARFEKEAAALAALSHPNIVAILDKGCTRDTYFLVMEHIDGSSLREVMRSPSLDSSGSLRAAVQICRAVEYAHGRGVIHRDLKPENILFDEQAGGIPKVTDFGLANFTDKATPIQFHLTESHMAMGTFAYMAPEQRLDARKADHRADIYSLGVIFFELMVGELPMGSFEPPSRRKPGLDRRLDLIVGRCLKSDPKERYPSATELIADLEPLVPLSSTIYQRELSSIERLQQAGEKVLRTALRASAVAVVIAATIIVAVAAIRSRVQHAIPKMAGEQIAAEFLARGVISADARRERSDAKRSINIGRGPDRVSILAYGRPVIFEHGSLRFASIENNSVVGRAVPDLTDNDGRALRAAAEVESEVLPSSLWARTRRAILGETPHPRAAILLTGSPGRYAAVVLSGRGDPVSFEWALGERRGQSLSGFPMADDRLWLELLLDSSGDLRAYTGSGKDRRPIGEPVKLGSGWKKHFGDMPIATLGCIEGSCQFFNVSYEIESEPKPAPAPPPPAAKANVPAKTAPAKAAPARTALKSTTPKHPPARTTAKKTVHHRTH